MGQIQVKLVSDKYLGIIEVFFLFLGDSCLQENKIMFVNFLVVFRGMFKNYKINYFLLLVELNQNYKKFRLWWGELVYICFMNIWKI